MDTPRERTRPIVKDAIRPKGRSKSAQTFKDSPFYEKFLFFENIKASAAKARSSVNVGGICKSADKSLRERPQQVYPANHHIKGHLSAGFIGCPSGTNQQTTLRSASSTINRASKLHFSHGKTSHSNLASSLDVRHRYSGRNLGPTTSEASHPIHGLSSSRSWSSSATRNSHVRPSHIASSDTMSEDTSVINYCHELNSSTLKKSERTFYSSSTIDDTERSSTTNTIHRHRRPASGSSSSTPSELRHVRESSAGHNSGRDTKLSSEVLEIKAGPEYSPMCSSSLSDDTSLDKSISTVDHSDSAITEEVNLCRSDLSLKAQAVPIKYPSSPPEHPNQAVLGEYPSSPPEHPNQSVLGEYPSSMPEYPNLDISKHSFETPVKNISTARIVLKNPVLPKEITGRKIKVIETRHPKPYMALDACPRFNDWLSSVMKMQKEHEHTEHWAFPEYERVASTVPSISHKHVASTVPSSSHEHVASTVPSISHKNVALTVPSISHKHVAATVPSSSHEHVASTASSISQEHVAATVPSSSHEPGSPITSSHHKAASTPEQHPSSTEASTISERPTLKHCSTKATNTDVSFASEHLQLDSLIESCLDISPVSTFPHSDTTNDENHGKHIEYSPSSNRCSYCRTDGPGDQVNVSSVNRSYQPPIQFDQIHKFPQTSNNLYDRSYTHARNAINRANGATKCSDYDLHGSEIKIQITDEDVSQTGPMAQFYPKPCDNRETHGSKHRFRGTSDTAPRMFAPRGVSPHYMFPTSHPAWEEEDVSRYLMSPRNSIGSISSVLSYKSSNADSAVDLGPPDDDQDFEYADFLAQHQARRFSQPNENVLFMEKQAMEDSLTNYHLDNHPYAERSFRCLQTASITPDGKWTPYCIPQKADYYQLETANFRIPSARREPYFMAADVGSCDYRVPQNRVGSSLELATRRHSQPESVAAFQLEYMNRSFQHAPLLHGANPPPNSAIHHMHGANPPSNSVIHHMHGANPPSNSVIHHLTGANPLSNSAIHHMHGTNPPSNSAIHHNFHDPFYTNAGIFRKYTSIPEPHGDPDLLRQPPQTLNVDTFQEQPRHHIIPELVISDHSDNNNSGQGSPTSQLGKQDIDLDSPFLSRPGSSMSSSEHEQLELEETGFLRSTSMSSLCSIASTCSTCTVVSDSDSQPPGKKQSSWKKIRSFILWSPFIQVFKKHRYPWIQLAGHQGNFHAGEAGSVLKKLDSREQASFQKLMADTLKAFVPEYTGDVEKNGETYIQLQDLLCSFSHPCVMDVKMGIRTYLEEELQKARRSPTLRKDMYQKMIEIDCTAPTTEEHEQKAVTKPRYMQWRDEMSSSVELGFRVEGIKKSDGNSSKDFKKTKTRDSIVDILKSFFGINDNIVTKYINRLNEMMKTQETSDFFQSHEVIGSSLLFVHDADENVGVWMIDFGKSEPLPDGVKIDHRNSWLEGNHEDGYLFGLDNLISVLEEVQRSLISTSV